MKKTINTLIDALEKELKLIESEESNILKKSELSIYKTQECLKNLEKFALSANFKNIQEEIFFFKELKPRIFSKLIYYVKVYNIESKRPNGSDRVQKRYLINELDRLKSFFDNNLEFYQYYRTGATYLDDKYFIRGKHDIRLSLDTFFFATNSKFSTSHDYKVSKILANELLRIYLNAELTTLERKEEHPSKYQHLPKTKLNWTHSKTALIELIYALHSQGVFDNSNADIKDIADYCEAVFNIDLGDYYRTYLEIRIRKSGRTKFLDSLKENFIKKMDQQDEK